MFLAFLSTFAGFCVFVCICNCLEARERRARSEVAPLLPNHTEDIWISSSERCSGRTQRQCSAESIRSAPKPRDQSDRRPRTQVPQPVSPQGANLNAADTSSSSKMHAAGATLPVLVESPPMEEMASAGPEAPRKEVLPLPKKLVPPKPAPLPRLVLVLVDGNECVVSASV